MKKHSSFAKIAEQLGAHVSPHRRPAPFNGPSELDLDDFLVLTEEDTTPSGSGNFGSPGSSHRPS